jgi:hypothetical protein
MADMSNRDYVINARIGLLASEKSLAQAKAAFATAQASLRAARLVSKHLEAEIAGRSHG